MPPNPKSPTQPHSDPFGGALPPLRPMPYPWPEPGLTTSRFRPGGCQNSVHKDGIEPADQPSAARLAPARETFGLPTVSGCSAPRSSERRGTRATGFWLWALCPMSIGGFPLIRQVLRWSDQWPRHQICLWLFPLSVRRLLRGPCLRNSSRHLAFHGTNSSGAGLRLPVGL